jgi:hypothetical protein
MDSLLNSKNFKDEQKLMVLKLFHKIGKKGILPNSIYEFDIQTRQT